MSLVVILGKAVGQLLVEVASDVLSRAAKRVSAAAERKSKPVVPPAPGRDPYTTGLFDGIERERARQLELRMTEAARQQLDERSDEK